MVAFRAATGGGGGDTTAPSAPPNLTATAVSSTQINLSWTASTDNVGVTGYQIERCTGTGCSNFALLTTVTTTSYNNTGLAASTTYRYRLRAPMPPGTSAPIQPIASATTQSGTGAQPPTVAISSTGGRSNADRHRGDLRTASDPDSCVAGVQFQVDGIPSRRSRYVGALFGQLRHRADGERRATAYGLCVGCATKHRHQFLDLSDFLQCESGQSGAVGFLGRPHSTSSRRHSYGLDVEWPRIDLGPVGLRVSEPSCV